MAESMVGLKRTHRCTEVTTAHIGQEVTVMGWVQKSRNKGGIIFVDLRDRSGILQIIFEENDCGAENFAKAEKLRSEFVVAVTGRVEARSGAVNTNLATGAIEIRANSMRILSESETPPFPIEENSKTKEELRLKYRFLDLRRPDIQRNLMLRSKVAYLMRDFMAKEGFIEIETPVLTNFYLAEGEKQGIGTQQSHERYDILLDQLEETPRMGMEDVRDALDSVSKDNFGEFESTEWSIVMNLSDGEARYYHRENYSQNYTFRLEA